MRKITAPFPYLNPVLLAILFLFSGCGTYQRFYQSPFFTVSEPYHVIPLKADSLRSATYISGGITAGSANEDFSDDVFAFTGSFYRSHNIGHFQAYYGASIGIGSYEVSRHDFVERNGARMH